MTENAGRASGAASPEILRDLSGHFRQAAEQLSRPNPDYSLAFEHLERAAREGVIAAQLDLAHLFEHGLGVAVDHAEARHWYQEAAQRGCRRAQVHLAVSYRHGDSGARADHAEAAYWYERAAEHGDKVAMGNLGIMYALGIGVRQDIVEAFLWLTSAVGMGNEAVAGAQKWVQSCLRDESRTGSLPVSLKDGMRESPECELCLMGVCDTVQCQNEGSPYLIPPAPGQ